MRAPAETVSAVEDALVDPAFADRVDMVITCEAPDRYRVATADGSVTFERRTVESTDHDGGPVERHDYRVVASSGADPLADRSTERYLGLDDERAAPAPHRGDNAFPHAFDHIAQFFDAPHAPDLLVQHTTSHRYGGDLHPGQHGSLSVVQARAPFIASGAGVARRGLVADSARMVDVAPTLLWLLGTDPHPESVGPTGERRAGGLLRRQDGDVRTDLVEHGGADHVVVVLLDGCNANVLHHAMQTGLAPTIAALADDGTDLDHGLMASLPTATLANHTTASTGVHPGHSGVVHNMWLDRERDHIPDLLALDQVFSAMVHLDDGVESLHDAIHRSRPGAFTATLFELCDAGADFSSFGEFRAGRPPSMPARDELLAACAPTSGGFLESSGAYGFMSGVDEVATRQAVALWERREGNPLPTLTFLALSLTDEAGHEGGPYSDLCAGAIADSDRRVRRVVEAVDRAGALDRTAFVVLADHGMQESSADNVGTWDDALGAAASRTGDLRPLDVADGFVYLVPAAASRGVEHSVGGEH